VRAAVVARRVTAVDVVAAALRRATSGDDHLRAFVALRGEEAIAEAAAVDAALAEGGAAPQWAGVPIAVKGSAGVHRRAAGLDSEQARRLRSAGAVAVGVTATPRGGGPQTWGFTDRGPTRNPWAPQLTPGGSSAGSAAAVAAGVVPVACGSDGAGSARIPAAWCGIFGYKPTTALVARLDHSGLGVPAPLARDPRDLAGWAEIVIGALPSTGPPVRACWSADLGYGLPRKTLMRFLLKLLAGLHDQRDGDAMDRTMDLLLRLTPQLKESARTSPTPPPVPAKAA